jgi:hypothetical protein
MFIFHSNWSKGFQAAGLYIPQICISRIPAFAFWHIPPKHKGSSSASTTDDQLTSLIYFVNDSELLTVHRERINLWS